MVTSEDRQLSSGSPRSRVFALDPSLDGVIRSIRTQSADVPLAIARFTVAMRADTPVEAMQRATSESLERYYRLSTSAKRIDVGTLCRSMGVELEGVPVSATASSLQRASTDEITRSYGGLLDFSGSVPVITIPRGLDYTKARIAAAHELGHVLIHKRASGYDQATIRLGTTSTEEALAEYAGRLLLVPRGFVDLTALSVTHNFAVKCVELADEAGVSVHAAVARLGDPDLPNIGVRGAILWRPRARSTGDGSAELAPYWHLCGSTFVPLRRGGVRDKSLVARLFADFDGPIWDSSREDVRIGRLCGAFMIDAFAWGSKRSGARVVLSVFRSE
jgi:IrrE N-terminal-like domain